MESSTNKVCPKYVLSSSNKKCGRNFCQIINFVSPRPSGDKKGKICSSKKGGEKVDGERNEQKG